MSNKRNNELVSKVNSILESESVTNNLSLDDRKELRRLLSSYESATYETYDDRHQFYREMVSDMVNDFGFRDEALAQSLANEHPTLQQSFMRFVTMFIKNMSKKGYFDDRNKKSVQLAQSLAPIIEANGYLPMV